MASEDDVLGALLLKHHIVAPEHLAWAIGELVRAQRNNDSSASLESTLRHHRLVDPNILQRAIVEASSGRADVELAHLDWLRRTFLAARERFGVPQRPETRPFSSDALRASLLAGSAPESQRPTTARFDPNALARASSSEIPRHSSGEISAEALRQQSLRRETRSPTVSRELESSKPGLRRLSDSLPTLHTPTPPSNPLQAPSPGSGANYQSPNYQSPAELLPSPSSGMFLTPPSNLLGAPGTPSIRSPSGINLAAPSALNLAAPSGANLMAPSGGQLLAVPPLVPTNANPLVANASDEVLRRPTQTALSRDTLRRRTGTRWGRYEVADELGRGAMGAVYRAYDLENDRREVAIKVLLQGERASGDLLERFKREARTLARLDHPAIVRVLDNGVYQGRAYIAMEFVAGTPLEKKLPELPLARGVALLETIANALDHAHEQGVVHRDLKPENILLTSDGKPKIMDFGLAKLTDDESQNLTRAGDLVGTPIYMSPEQIRGDLRAQAPTFDLWALGVIFYKLLTGELPFRGHTVEAVARIVCELDPPPPHELRPDLPRDLSLVCMKMLAKNPASRYTRARDVAEDLRRYLRGESITFGSDSDSGSGSGSGSQLGSLSDRIVARPAKSKALLVLAILSLGILISGAAVFESRRRKCAQAAQSLSTQSELARPFLQKQLEQVLLGKLDSLSQAFDEAETSLRKARLETDPWAEALEKQRSSALDTLKDFEACRLIARTLKSSPAELAESLQQQRSSLLSSIGPKPGSSNAQLLLQILAAMAESQSQRVTELIDSLRSKTDAPQGLDPLEARWLLLSKQPERAVTLLLRAIPAANLEERKTLQLELVAAQLQASLNSEARKNLREMILSPPSGRGLRERLAHYALELDLVSDGKSDLSTLIRASEELPPNSSLRLAHVANWLEKDCPEHAIALLRDEPGEDLAALRVQRFLLRARAQLESLEFGRALSDAEQAFELARKHAMASAELKALTLRIRLHSILGEDNDATRLITDWRQAWARRSPSDPSRNEAAAELQRLEGDRIMLASMIQERNGELGTGAINPWLESLKLSPDPATYRRLMLALRLFPVPNEQTQAFRDTFYLRVKDFESALESDEHPLSRLARLSRQIAGLPLDARDVSGFLPYSEELYRLRELPRGGLAGKLIAIIRRSLAWRSGNFDDSERRDFERLLRALTLCDPTDPVTYRLWRTFEAARGDRNQAIVCGTKSYIIDPTDPDNYIWYGSVQSRPEASIGLLRSGLNLLSSRQTDAERDQQIRALILIIQASLKTSPPGDTSELCRQLLSIAPREPQVIKLVIEANGNNEASRQSLETRLQESLRASKSIDELLEALQNGPESSVTKATNKLRDQTGYWPKSRDPEARALLAIARLRSKPPSDEALEAWRDIADATTAGPELVELALREVATDPSFHRSAMNGASTDVECGIHAIAYSLSGSTTARAEALPALEQLWRRSIDHPEDRAFAVWAAIAQLAAGAPEDSLSALRRARHKAATGTLALIEAAALAESDRSVEAREAAARAKTISDRLSWRARPSLARILDDSRSN